jgi:2-methylcitrate dehydratase PrpD
LFGKAGLDQYTHACVRDPAVLDLRRKVEIQQNPDIPVEATAVDILTKDGKLHRASVDSARGSARRPLSDAELEEKFLTLAAALRSKNELRRLVEAIWEFDRAQDASSILALARPAAEMRGRRSSALRHSKMN